MPPLLYFYDFWEEGRVVMSFTLVFAGMGRVYATALCCWYCLSLLGISSGRLPLSFSLIAHASYQSKVLEFE
jgi:hypothetical protein